MHAACDECDRLWRQYASLAQARLALIREQQSDAGSQAVRFRMPLGQRVQRLAELQMQVRRRLAEHESARHCMPPHGGAGASRDGNRLLAV